MNNTLVILMVIIVLLASRRQRWSRPQLSGPRIFAIFAVILMMHVMVIGGLLAYEHLKHS